MTEVVHLSDLHFGAEDPAVVAALHRCLRALAPELIAVSGDFTQRARSSQFTAAAHFFGALSIPMIGVPGNHDIPLHDPIARALRPFRRYADAFGPLHDRIVRVDRLRVIALNTVRRQRRARGAISRQQSAWVAREVRKAPSDLVTMVVMHHPIAVARRQDEGERAAGGAAAVRAWQAAGVDLVLSGHLHQPYLVPAQAASTTDGAQAAAITPSSARPWMLNAGSATSVRLRHGFPNGFNRIVTGIDGRTRRVAVERWDYAGRDDGFRCHGRRVIALDEP